MNGRQHGWTGLAAALATAPLVDFPGAPIPLCVAATTGASIMPDSDHLQASFAQMWGRPTKTLAAAVNATTGGHRGATHGWITGPLIGVTVLAAGTAAHHAGAHLLTSDSLPVVLTGAALTLAAVTVWALLIGTCISVADKLLPIRVTPARNAAASYLTAAALIDLGVTPLGVAVPVAIGMTVHRLGDTVHEHSLRAKIIVGASIAFTALWAAAVHILNLKG